MTKRKTKRKPKPWIACPTCGVAMYDSETNRCESCIHYTHRADATDAMDDWLHSLDPELTKTLQRDKLVDAIDDVFETAYARLIDRAGALGLMERPKGAKETT